MMILFVTFGHDIIDSQLISTIACINFVFDRGGAGE